MNTIKKIFAESSKAEQIHDLSDYRRVKKWVSKISTLYAAATVVALIIILFLPVYAHLINLPTVLTYIFAPAVTLLTCWGYATLLMYLPIIIKSVIKSGGKGYHIGEQVETTHVDVTHEYGNKYRVTARTDNKGCLFAIIAGSLKFMIWSFYCVYIGTFLILKKLWISSKNLKDYSAK